MKTVKCDVCKRTEPEISCRYSRKKIWGWFRFDDDSQGGSEMRLDLCEECWNEFTSFMQNRIAQKIGAKKIGEKIFSKIKECIPEGSSKGVYLDTIRIANGKK